MKITLLLVVTVYVCKVYPYGPNQTEVEAALEKAREINLLKRGINFFEREFSDNSRSVHRCPLSFHHGIRQQVGDKVSESKTNDALLAVRILMQGGGYSSSDLEQESVTEMFERMKGLKCDIPYPGKCDFKTTYRTADGSCNNIQNPNWGMAGNIQQRVIRNDYDDKVGSPRTTGLKKTPLPNPRTVSNKVHQNPQTAETSSSTLTLHIMGFGQFLDHDIARTPEQETVDDCCDEKFKNDTDYCFNIIIPESEHELSPIFESGYCMQVKRSAPVFCKDGVSRRKTRQQTNAITSFIDASNVYGSSSDRQAKLRENGNGFRMDTTMFSQEERILDGPSNTCILTDDTQQCSLAGDIRVNELPTLTSYHFLFVKEHNRIAEKIKGFFKGDEIIFQETRRIVIAIMQKIVYDEFLPAFFSKTGLEAYNLRSDAAYEYEPDSNPTLVNSFGIAYRYGHTWIPQQMQLFSKYLKPIDEEGFTRNTEEIFLNPVMTYLPDAFAKLAYFLSGRPSPLTDNVLEEAVRSRLFINEQENLSFDLAALNIQRGRDHGLPSYNKYRKWCNLTEVSRKWRRNGNSGLVDHSPKMIYLLEHAGYSSPRDIDLFTGGLTETNLPGGEIGPTFECIIGRHFRNLKFGDRLWYQNEDAGFTNDQIQAIQSYSLARVLCNNYNFLKINSPSAFKSTDDLTYCDKIPDLDLSVFAPKGIHLHVSSKRGKDENLERVLTELEELANNFGVREDLKAADEDVNEDLSVDGVEIDSFSLDEADSERSLDDDNLNVNENDLRVNEYIERLIEELETK